MGGWRREAVGFHTATIIDSLGSNSACKFSSSHESRTRLRHAPHYLSASALQFRFPMFLFNVYIPKPFWRNDRLIKAKFPVFQSGWSLLCHSNGQFISPNAARSRQSGISATRKPRGLQLRSRVFHVPHRPIACLLSAQ